MAKIAVVVMGAHGHVNPTLAVAEELVRRGHQVSYWTTEPFRDSVLATAANFHPLDSLMSKAERPKKFDPSMTLRMLPKMILGEALHQLPQLEVGFKKEKPDLVLYDNMCVAGRVIAESYNLPRIALHTTYSGNAQFNIMRQLGDLPPETQVEYDDMMTEICSKYKVRSFPFTDIFGHVEDLNLAFMPREWQPQSETFDERHVFVGPCLGTRHHPEAFPQEVFERGAVLFISLGTAFNDQPEFYRNCFKAFGESPWNVIMAIGTKMDVTSLGEAPANFTVRQHVPQIDVLKHTRVFLTHGGMNSTMEALTLGIPLVTLPQMFEQGVTANRIQEMGVGLSLGFEEVSAEKLRQAIDEVAENAEMRHKAKTIQAAIQAAGGPTRAGDAIERYLCRIPTKATQHEGRMRELEAT